ncbi:hypothetical protein ABT160_14855 [Streptomyces sp. NPDC001941]|uniref:hypothetical protein n=1 Tax=Streptomyces sp. NPDC001941 TaxID=3154659 RepID=UPI003319C469
MKRSARPLPHALTRAAAVFVLSAGAVAPALAVAPAAYADGVTVSRTTTSDDGRLDIGLPADALWVKVSVLASKEPGAAVLASTDELTWRGGGWTTDAALRLPAGTAYGDYPVGVEYRMPNGTVQRWTGGSYSHKLHTGVSGLAFDRASTDYDHRDVVLSGKVNAFDAATGTREPARAGTRVQIAVHLANRTSTFYALSDADGSFALPFTPGDAVRGGTATVVTPAADTDPDDPARLPDVDLEQTQYRISAETGRYRVQQGQPVTVTGRAERLTDDGWKPFTGAEVVSSMERPNGAWADVKVGSGTVKADGTFTYTGKALSTGDVNTFVKPSPYFESQPFDRSEIAVPKPFVFSNVTVALDAYGTLRVGGRALLGGSYCTNEPIVLQYSVDGRTWRNLDSVDSGDSDCGFAFEGGGFIAAYYRVWHPETDTYREAVSKPVHQTRVQTRFLGAGYSTTKPRTNAAFTASGTVQRYVNKKWQAYPGARVTLVFKPKGETDWYWVTKGKTASNGRYSLKGKAYGDGSWAVVTEPANGYFYSETKVTYIDAR